MISKPDLKLGVIELISKESFFFLHESLTNLLIYFSPYCFFRQLMAPYDFGINSLHNTYKRLDEYVNMEDWATDPSKVTETNLNQVLSPEVSLQGELKENYHGISEESYQEPEMIKDVNGPTKNLVAIFILLGIGFLITLGFTNDIRYLYIIGLSLLGLVILSAIVRILKSGNLSFWDVMIVRDLIEILGYIIMGIIHLIIAILSDS